MTQTHEIFAFNLDIISFIYSFFVIDFKPMERSVHSLYKEWKKKWFVSARHIIRCNHVIYSTFKMFVISKMKMNRKALHGKHSVFVSFVNLMEIYERKRKTRDTCGNASLLLTPDPNCSCCCKFTFRRNQSNHAFIISFSNLKCVPLAAIFVFSNFFII